MKKLLVLILFLFASTFQTTEAKCRRTATIKSQQQNGWSKLYTVDVNFMTGNELNKATNSYSYEGWASYAVIFWTNEQVTIIKLVYFPACGLEVTCECMQYISLDLQGTDQEGRKWNICLSQTCY
jgi:hypothetical protein